MTTVQDALAAGTYALFALQQPIELDEIAAAAVESRFPLADSKTPDWFSAAASQGSSLLETAPELLVLPADLDSADLVDVRGIDLVRMYAPELNAIEDIEEPEPVVEVVHAEPVTHEKPRTSTQIGLLKELLDLDG